MALCVVNPQIEAQDTKFDKCALKLLGIDHFELTEEEILENVSHYVDPVAIKALLFDKFNQFYVLFLKDIESTCRLIGKKIKIRSKHISFFPLLACYVVENVYPCVSNEELRDILKPFGNVFTVCDHRLVPNSSKFSHVLSGKREVTFLLPGSETEIYMPVNIVHPPYSPFHVRKYCCGCFTEGHSVLHCPDIDDQDPPKPEKVSVDSDSEDELEALIKAEDIDMFENNKMESSLPDTKSHVNGVETSKETEVLSLNDSNNSTENTKDDEMKKDEVVENAPQKEKSSLPSKTSADPSTIVVSSAAGVYYRTTESGLYSACR